MQDEWKKFTETLPVVLKAERKKRNISHEKLANITGLSRQAIGRIESKNRNPQMVTIFRLVRGMGMTLEEFSRILESSFSRSEK